MGCQNSKLNVDPLAIPPKLRPLLWRKVEELRRRRNGDATNGSALLKKELLRDGGREESDAFSRGESLLENKSISMSSTPSPDQDGDSSHHDLVSQPITTIILEDQEKKMSKEEVLEEDQKVLEDHNNNNYNLKENENQEISGQDEKEKEKEEEEENRDRDEGVEEDNEGHEANIGPSSPSFRVYFLESLEENVVVEEEEEEENDKGKDDSIKDENDTQNERSRENRLDSVVLIDSNKDQETKIVKKRSGKSRMRIRRAIWSGGPVKHLLNVTSCYHPTNERASLLARKST